MSRAPARRCSQGAKARLRYRAQPGWIAADAGDAGRGAARAAAMALRAQARRRAGAGLRDRRERCGSSRATGSRSRAPIPSWWRRSRFAVRGDAVLDGEVVALDPDTGLSQLRPAAAADAAPRRRCGPRREPAWRSSSTCSTACSTRGSTSPACRWWTERRCCATWSGTTIRSASRRSAPPARPRCTARRAPRARRGSSPSGRTRRYVSARSTDWLKIKCVQQQEFVIGGYTAPQGSRGTSARCWWATTTHGRAALRGQGRHRLRPRARWSCSHRKLAPLHRRTSPFAPGPVPAGDGAVGHAEAGGADRIRRVDPGGAAPASAVPRTAGGQGGARRCGGRASSASCTPPPRFAVASTFSSSAFHA